MTESVWSSVDDYVNFCEGTHAIKKILIANNGIGATKAIKSLRRWSYETFGDERMIQFVVMATPDDMRANAEYIRLADQVVDVPGGTNNNNYANVNLICEIAEMMQVDAVMPMWGHASENPLLPTSISKIKRKVTFIGPPAEPMQALGDKIGSTIIAQSAGVPTIAWNGDDLVVDYKSTGIPPELYDLANVKTAPDALECANRIGYPVMIKASEGGGGKGIRKVLKADDVISSFRQVQGEVPGSPIFVMKMASQSRHLEVQLLADAYGNAIALSGRDCSVQRRHQKIIEEGPPIIAPKNVFEAMEKAAVALAKTVGYVNAGTVEYLYLDEKKSFAFLELNPRLQVEHPVTENILGINLPACQLQVAMGIPLHRIADIRKMYGRHPLGKDNIDFEFAERKPINRHCIAVRVTAENPDSGFQPTSGRLSALQFHSSIDVWGYFSVNNSGSLHEFADSQFGHIFASGPNRESARRAMITALNEIQIRGDIRTTVEYIIKLMQSEDFMTNTIDTTWLDSRIANYAAIEATEGKLLDPRLVTLCGAAVQSYQHFKQKGQEFVDMLRIGHIPSKDILAQKVSIDLIYKSIKYRTICTQCSQTTILVDCNDVTNRIIVRLLADGGFLLNVNNKSHLAYTQEEGNGCLRMTLDGKTCIFTPEYDPTRLTSAVAGKVARLLVANGSHLNAGDSYVEVEVMKMYMPLKVAESGTINFQVSEGAVLSPGDLIASLRLDNPEKVVKSDIFNGVLSFDEDDMQTVISTVHPHLTLREASAELNSVLDGYILSPKEIDKAFNNFVASVSHELLPYFEIEESLCVLKGRIGDDLIKIVSDLNSNYREQALSIVVEYPADQILLALHKFCQSLEPERKTAFNSQTATIWSTVEQYLYPSDTRLLSFLLKFIESFLQVEKLFDNMSFTDVVSGLRKDYSSDLEKLLNLCRSHINLSAKTYFMIRVIDEIKRIKPPMLNQRSKMPTGFPLKSELNIRHLKLRLSDISKLRQQVYSHVALAANLVIMEQYTMTIDQRRQRLNEVIGAALASGDPIGTGDRSALMQKFAETNIAIRDLLLESLGHDIDYQIAFVELYLRKIYQKTHVLNNMDSGTELAVDEGKNSFVWVKFDFITRGVDAVSELDNEDISFSSYNQIAGLARSNRLNTAICSDSENEDGRAELGPVTKLGTRLGIFTVIESYNELSSTFSQIISKIPSGPRITPLKSGPVNAAYIVIMRGPLLNDEETSQQLSGFLRTEKNTELLKAHGIRRITFLVGLSERKATSSNIASIFTFRDSSGFVEDRLYRHIESTHAFHLDLTRLSNFSITLIDGLQTSSGNVHLYHAIPKIARGLPRYFARLVSFSADLRSSDTESLFVEALDYLGLVLGQDEAKSSMRSASANHIFLTIVAPDSVVEPDTYVVELKRICSRYSQKLLRLSIAKVEIKLTCRLVAGAEPMYLRLVASNPTGYVLRIDQYYEAFIGGRPVFKSIGTGPKGEWDGLPTNTPYSVNEKFESERAEALASSDTLYVYDWPVLFERGVLKIWDQYIKETSRTKADVPEMVFSCVELVVHKRNKVNIGDENVWVAEDLYDLDISPVEREPGQNKIGIVAWLITYKSPEIPTGRDLVVICNDITHQAGSFGTKEDVMFFKASEFARKRKIPRIYLAANSGARIGMAQSLKDKFEICWLDNSDPSKGFRYIYLTEEHYDSLVQKVEGNIEKLPIICSPVHEDGQTRMMITDIIGTEPDLGVENLMGSGLIAGETARAYDDIFTLTIVVGRTVGIGAYLVRLGQRTIQRTRASPIILTGFQALNKLMGREIYTTNDQLGGPMIMFPNGVSHQLAETHMDSINKALNWMSFIPSCKGANLPIRNIEGVDIIERPVSFIPLKGITYDPRYLLCGLLKNSESEEEEWISGFFDKDSFVETLSGWAKTVVVGRARLGGIPIGVIVTENRTSEATKPADPADLSSQEKMVQQAGGVWFPDSAYKTAQALRDFNREELPCIIFANWRGFSGGQRDMFDEVLKFGSMIVDALVAYQQPLFVYIPPHAELRGGAWVVVDSTINPDIMEFYAAEDSRGGVLEAAGAASIKFREKDIVATIHRLDHILIDLDKQASGLESDSIDLKMIKKQIKDREKLLFGVYQQIAVHFADLHDTPGRMQAKGVIRRQVRWSESRVFFYWRLRRRLTEIDMSNKVRELDSTKSKKAESVALLKDWFLSTGGSSELFDDDKYFITWMLDHEYKLHSYLAKLRDSAVVIKLQDSLRKLLNAAAVDEDQSAYTTRICQAAMTSFSEDEQRLVFEAFKSIQMNP